MKERLITANIVEALDRSGALKFKELFKIIKKLFKIIKKMHNDVEEHSFKENLMVMEIQGLIRVYTITKGKLRIELNKNRG